MSRFSFPRLLQALLLALALFGVVGCAGKAEEKAASAPPQDKIPAAPNPATSDNGAAPPPSSRALPGPSNAPDPGTK